MSLSQFDAYEIHPCHQDPDNPECIEVCSREEAEFWTLYGHLPEGGVQAIGDFDTEAHAAEIYTRITGKAY